MPNNRILKAFTIALAVLLTGVLLAIGLVWLNQNRIKQYAVGQINAYLKAPVAVGEIDIAFFQQFPRVSLRFAEVQIADALRPKRSLFEAQRVYIAFDFWDIITRSYTIKEIDVDSGYCWLYSNKKGEVNYDIWKSTGADSTPIWLKLEQIKLQKMRLVYEDQSAAQWIDLHTKDVEVSLAIRDKIEKVSVDGDLYLHQIKKDAYALLSKRALTIELDAAYNETNKQLAIAKGNIAIGTLPIALTGDFTFLPTSTKINASFEAPKATIGGLMELVPGTISKSIAAYETAGNIFLKGSINGIWTETKQPKIVIEFGVEDGRIKTPYTTLTDIAAKGRFTNGAKQSMESAALVLTDVRLKAGNGKANGSLTISNFNNPFISLNVDAQLDIQTALSLFQQKQVTVESGNFNCTLQLKGTLADLTSKAGFSRCETSGFVETKLQQLKLASGQTIQSLNASLQVNQHDFVVDQLALQLNQSDLKVKGVLRNAIPYLLASNQVLKADLTCQSSSMVLDQLMAITAAQPNAERPVQLNNNIELLLALDIKQLRWNLFEAQQLLGRLNWKGHIIEVPALSFKSMEGTSSLSGAIEGLANGNYAVSIHAQAQQVDLQQLFRQCNNFGQNELTEKHLRGKLTTTVDLLGIWNQQLVCDLPKLKASASIEIRNGQLIQYEPLYELSKFVKIDDLKSLQFADLRNTILIENETILIPQMDVNNNALNLSVSGTHSFTNMLDYHLRIKFSDLLAQKFKQRHSEFEEEVLDNGTYVYIGMKGPIDKLEFSYDKKMVRKQMQEQLKQERQEVKKIWRAELGLDKDSILQKESNSEELEFEPE
jgi:hypothetical protein